MEPIRLMLVDDHDIVRTGLRSFLETQEGLMIVGEASGGAEALEQVLSIQPDVVVMDITMPDMDGLEATRRLKALAPRCQVLALTIHGDKQYFFEMLAAGATGYLTKQAAAEELVAAIRAVATGNVYLQPVLARWLLEDYRRLLVKAPQESQGEEGGSPRQKSLEALSKRESQVLELVAQGMTNPQIGASLGISPKTVARHRERIMDKLNLHSSTELVKYAIRTGLISVD
ncbi:MAG: response regulator transcription factor [Anaerolineales bacterium]|nr:response regulator transcription factor [Anaerolineales bacterium]